MMRNEPPTHLVLIGCGKAKADHAAHAKDLYIGDLFRKSRRWAEQRGTHWRILSAKFGLLHPNRWVEPYDRALTDMTPAAVAEWANLVEFQLWDLVRSNWPKRVTILAGAAYVGALLKIQMVADWNPAVPLDGLGIGQRLKWLKEQTEGAAA